MGTDEHFTEIMPSPLNKDSLQRNTTEANNEYITFYVNGEIFFILILHTVFLLYTYENPCPDNNA